MSRFQIATVDIRLLKNALIKSFANQQDLITQDIHLHHASRVTIIIQKHLALMEITSFTATSANSPES
jgi:hypothetical protein